MSDEIMISIRPKWCELIKSGQKTAEIRKTRPADAENKAFYRVYIYQTGGGGVIGSFILRNFKYIQAAVHPDGTRHLYNVLGLQHCVDDEVLFNYLYRETGRGDPYPGGWAWLIEDLVIFDKPMNLEQFGLKRPPQSWQYI